MEPVYVVTGAAGHLGNVVVRELLAKKRRVWQFLLEDEQSVVEGTERIFSGDVTICSSLIPLFEALAREQAVVIHCAGIVSIRSEHSDKLKEVNVGGTRNIVDLCVEFGVSQLIYVSSVHAIPDSVGGAIIREITSFSPDQVVGQYAKTKAEASAYVLAAASRGLAVKVVHPSGIIGPYDYGHGHMTQMVLDYCAHRLIAGMSGGYDFVDVRDVARGIIACADRGRPGECYILSNRYFEIREILNLLSEITGKQKIRSYLPTWFIRRTAPLAELYYRLRHESPLFTSYSIETLTADNHYSHDKAATELGFQTRDMRQTLYDTWQWLAAQGRIKP